MTVFYTWGQSTEKVYDARFGIERSWDIPILEGYKSEFIQNTACRPDSNRFFGIVNHGLYRRLKQEKYDAVLIFRWSVWSHFLLLQRLGKRPLLFFRGDSHLLQERNVFRKFIKQLLLQFIYRKVDVAFATGTYSREYFLFSGLTSDRVVVAPHAVDYAFFSNDAERAERLALQKRRELGIPDDAVVFLYAGKFYGVKDLSLLIEAFTTLGSGRQHLLLAGGGEQEDALKSLAAGNTRIHFLPFHNQLAMPVLYRTGDVFVLPSKKETWGLSVNEAMSCERPVLVSDQCGCAPDLVEEGVTGFVFKAGDATHLQQQLARFTDRTVSQKMGQAAESFVQSFSLERIAAAIEQALK